MNTNGLQGFVFRGKHSSEYGIVLNKYNRSILAPLNERTVQVPNRPGAHFFGKQMNMREFKLEVTITGGSEADLNAKIRDIAKWISGDEEEEIVFDKEPDVSYFGYFTGSTDLQELATIGQTTLTFQCPDPYAYGPEFETPLFHTSPITATTLGREDTHPSFKVKFHAPSTFFTVGTKWESIFIGESQGEKSLVLVDPKLIDDNMSSTASWTEQSVTDGAPNPASTGSFYSNGYTFQVQDYGTGSGWHGPALKKMASEPVQDFSLKMHCGLYAGAQGNKGRIEAYLLDANGVIIGKIAIKDVSGYEISTFEARAGTLANGKYFSQFSGDVRKESKKVKVQNKVKGKDVTTYATVKEEYGGLRDWAGDLIIERVGN
jgi:predicted phage tail component-like protein